MNPSRVLWLLVSAALLPACSSSPAGGGEDLSTGVDLLAATPGCGDPRASPTMDCGTLSWATSAVKSRKRNHQVSVVAETAAGPFLYVAGGFDRMVVAFANVDRMAIGADGSLGEPVGVAPLPVRMGGFTGAVAGNAFVVGGGMGLSGVVDTSFSAAIQPDGSLAPWKAGGSVLHPRMHPAGFASGQTVYVLGGFSDPDVWDDVVRATVQADGRLSAWTVAGKLPGPRSHFSASLVDGYVFIAGGVQASALQNPPFLVDVARGRLAGDGTLGEWTAMPDMPIGLATHASFFYGGYLYVGGGINQDPAQTDAVIRAPILPDHSLGAWENAASLPVARGHVHQLPVHGNHVYSVAGAIDFNLASTDEIDVGTFQ